MKSNHEFSGSSTQVLSEVQQVFSRVVPGSVCELQDYEFRIGCGAMDATGTVQEVIFLRRHLTRDRVEAGALELERKLRRAEISAHTDD